MPDMLFTIRYHTKGALQIHHYIGVAVSKIARLQKFTTI
jgi:hypothetical protein